MKHAKMVFGKLVDRVSDSRVNDIIIITCDDEVLRRLTPRNVVHSYTQGSDTHK